MKAVCSLSSLILLSNQSSQGLGVIEQVLGPDLTTHPKINKSAELKESRVKFKRFLLAKFGEE
jgi:hypothetical protein